jgi:hypothetical protein
LAWAGKSEILNFSQPGLHAPLRRTLYERFGGYGIIAAFMNDYNDRMPADPLIARFKGGRD